MTQLSKYDTATQELIDALEELREAKGLGDNAFCKKHLTVSPTVYGRLKRNEYPGNVKAQITKLALDLRNLRQQNAMARQILGEEKFHTNETLDAIFNGVQLAHNRTNANRLCVYLAPTGGGKTVLAKQLKVQFDGILVEARESWRESYLGAIQDICDAAKIELDKCYSKTSAEKSLINGLKANRKTLIIDEGEYFGVRSINLLKLILNQTDTVIVLCAIPELYECWNQRNWKQASQLKRRLCVLVNAPRITARDVFKFTAEHFAFVDEDQAKAGCAAIAEEANKFGLYDKIARIIEDIASQNLETVNASDIDDAIKSTRQELGTIKL